jgi:hypothetical protein
LDLTGVSIKPAPGMVALRFVDDLDDDDDISTNIDVDNYGLIATVLGVGDDVKGVRKGSTVIVRTYARDGLKLGENSVLTEAYCVIATIT